MVAVMQQQLREVGIALDIRTFEFATFFADVTHGAFQLYSLRWIGGNEDPDIFEYAFHSAKFPPNGANRGYYSNPKVDALIDQARREVDQNKRKSLYAELQLILAEQLPYIDLSWYRQLVPRPQQARAQSATQSRRQLRLPSHRGTCSLDAHVGTAALGCPVERSSTTSPAITPHLRVLPSNFISVMRILFIGDIFGRPGRTSSKTACPASSATTPSTWSSLTARTPPPASASRPRSRKNCSS